MQHLRGMGLAWLCVLALTPALWAADEPLLEVDLGGAATDTPVPTPTALPTATPLPLPVQAPVALEATPEALSASAAAAPTPAEDLKQVRFDGKSMPEEDGLMIIAPGAASPEDSLESFGIESPFNWKERQNRTLEPGKDAAAAGNEELELSAPDSSDLKERVQVENGEGETLPSDGDYDRIERASAVVNAGEYRVDGTLARNKDGQIFAQERVQVALKMEPGRQVYPGSLYTVFRDEGSLSTQGQDAQPVGMLIRNVGVVKVVRIEGEEVLGRIEKQYEAIHEGDLIRLRDPDRLRYYASLRQGPANVALDLKGEVIGMMPPLLIQTRGGIVYLNIGKGQGVVPGMRLMLTRDAEDLQPDGIRSVRGTGRIGILEVVSVTHDACAAKVLQCQGEVRVGDRVRYR